MPKIGLGKIPQKPTKSLLGTIEFLLSQQKDMGGTKLKRKQNEVKKNKPSNFTLKTHQE